MNSNKQSDNEYDAYPVYRPDVKLWHHLKPMARQMRHEPTEAESVLWQALRNRQLDGVKFRRQHAIDRYIVDFVALEHHLIIEVDGDIHDLNPEHDMMRQALLESLGFTVIRFSNEQVLRELNTVRNAIRHVLGE